MTRKPWDDSKTIQEQREDDEQEKWEDYMESSQTKCDDCGQLLWKGNHLEECPEA